MSRVERTENPSERRGQQDHRPGDGRVNRRADSPGRTPGKAEGEEADVEQALERTPE